MQADPLGIDGGSNVYMMANLNPLWFIDPYGLCPDAKQAFDYWGDVAVSGFDRGGVGGYAQAAGASLMQGFIDFWGARSIQDNAEKSGYYSAIEGYELTALKYGSLAVGEIAVKASMAAGAMNAAHYSVKGGVHGAHHTFKHFGRRSHLQLNYWIKGVKGSGGAIRVPF